MNSNLTERDGLKRQGLLTRHLRWLSPSLVALVVMIMFGAAAPAAKADSYDFSLTDTSHLFDITFSLPSSPVPDSSVSGTMFTLNSVAYDINGTPETPAQMDFYSAGAAGGGMDIFNGSSYILNQGGDALYTGSESSPTFMPGVYDLTDLGGAIINNGDNFNLTITNGTPSVPTPEPSSLLMLGIGLLAMSGLIAYQQKKNGGLLAQAVSASDVAAN